MSVQRNQIQKVTVLGTAGAIDAKESGAWNYISGTGGASLSITGRIVGIGAVAVGGDGTITINGGTPITIRENNSFELNPKGNLANPSLIFSGTLDYFVEWVT